jgi:hypothetical protein
VKLDRLQAAALFVIAARRLVSQSVAPLFK